MAVVPVAATPAAPDPIPTPPVADEALDVSSPEDGAVAAVPSVVETSTEPKPVKVPKPVTAWEPTGQQIALGGVFTGLDMRLFDVQPMRQEGTPTIRQETVLKKGKVKEQTSTTDEQGIVTITEVEVSRDVPHVISHVDYTWGTAVPFGDRFASLTGALRAQKGYAFAHQNDGLAAKEYISKEYGVWYVQDPDGIKPGFRYSIAPVPAAPKPVTVRAPKEPKPPKPPKPPKAEKPPKAPKPTKGAVAAGATAAATGSDEPSVEIAEDVTTPITTPIPVSIPTPAPIPMAVVIDVADGVEIAE